MGKVLTPELKMTAVTITYNGKKYAHMLLLRYENGRAILSMERLNKMLERLRIPRGATFSIG